MQAGRTALESQALSCMHLAHDELESSLIIVLVVVVVVVVTTITVIVVSTILSILLLFSFELV